MPPPTNQRARGAAPAAVAPGGEAAPTRQSREVFDDLSARAAAQLQRLREVIDTDVAAFNTLIREAGTPAIMPTASSKERAKGAGVAAQSSPRAGRQTVVAST